MPHITIDYSANLSDELEVQQLVDAVHQAAIDSGVFPIGGVRTRAEKREYYAVADSEPTNAFVAAQARIGAGRDADVKKAMGQAIFRAMCDALEPIYKVRPLAISFDISEIDDDLSFKKNNLHEIIANRRQAEEGA